MVDYTSRTQALNKVRARLNTRFRTKTNKLLSGNDLNNFTFDYNNFLNFDKEIKYNSQDFAKEYKEEYDIIDFTKKQKKDIGLNLKQYFRAYYYGEEPHRCCFCGRLLEKSYSDSDVEYNISTIEHIFPKSKFPQYALCIDNWAPCCSECNSSMKGDSFFVSNPKQSFNKALQQLGIDHDFGHKPFNLWKNISFDFSSINGGILIKGKPQCAKNDEAFTLISYYGLEKRYKLIKQKLYNNLFNLIKFHHINSPESLENFLESCQNSNMLDMISDFSINNSPKIWKDFIDYILYDYNNLTALWEELKEYNKLQYFI